MAVQFVDVGGGVKKVLFTDVGGVKKVSLHADCCCGEVETDCCPDDPLPEELTASWVMTGCSTACSDTGNITLTYDGVDSWDGSGALGSCGKTVTLSLHCSDTPGCGGLGWVLEEEISDGCYMASTNCPPDSESCDPFEIVFEESNIGSGELSPCGCDPGDTDVRIQFTITE